MALKLSHCVPSDAPALAESYLCTWEQQPRHQVTYGAIPRDGQLEIYKKMIESLIASQDKPTPTLETHMLKVTDEATGEIIAHAIWSWLPQGYKPEEDSLASTEEVPEGANARLMHDFLKMTLELRGRGERKRPHWLLQLLGTHPKHERRGAGAMLIDWGLAQADKEGLDSYVDSSSVALNLYKKWGFTKEVGELVVDLDEYGGKNVGVHKWVALHREPPRGKTEN